MHHAHGNNFHWCWQTSIILDNLTFFRECKRTGCAYTGFVTCHQSHLSSHDFSNQFCHLPGWPFWSGHEPHLSSRWGYSWQQDYAYHSYAASFSLTLTMASSASSFTISASGGRIKFSTSFFLISLMSPGFNARFNLLISSTMFSALRLNFMP